MPNARSKKKTAPTVQASDIVDPTAAEPEEANASDTEVTADAEETGSDINPNILAALSKITDSITTLLDVKVDTVLAAIREQTSRIQALATRVGDAETRISGVEDTADVLQSKVAQLEKQVTDMADHMDDLENRSRRCNLRLVGLPEGSEGNDIVAFMETWLPSYKNGKIKLDRAHRSLAPKPGASQRARPIIMKLHNFADKQRVMAAARHLATQPNHPTDRIKVSFFNDYSAAVAKKRKAFDEVKSCLRKKNVDYALLYPATLRLSANGKEKRFHTLEAAASYAESLP
ncbi:alpha-2-macroglobulin-like protein [Sarotherodon galilaeus]